MGNGASSKFRKLSWLTARVTTCVWVERLSQRLILKYDEVRYLISNCLFTGYRIIKAIRNISSIILSLFACCVKQIIKISLKINNAVECFLTFYVQGLFVFFQNWRLLELFNPFFEIWVTVDGLNIHAPVTLFPKEIFTQFYFGFSSSFTSKLRWTAIIARQS